ncbi:unnamed protein product [Citrullus colocynthis]|uniref:Uncharacterized protein n=1 Tax=Citrullus colocynthis TaxID=252529 RepID=A0ABP0ZC06_9ROSI
MGREKRKGRPENSGGIYEKKIKKDETEAAVAEEPTDEEVEEFYLILRRMKQAAEYFGVEKGMLAKSLSVVFAGAADRGEKEEEEKGPDTAAPAPAEVKPRGKEKEVVEENGLRLDLNIALAVPVIDI